MQAPLVPPMRDRPFYNASEPTFFPDSWCPPLSGMEWASLNAFIARLHTVSPDLRYVDFKGMWALLEALEREQTPSALDDLVPTAACWILYAGRELRNNSEYYPQYDFDEGSKRLLWSVGEMYHGPKTFSERAVEFLEGPLRFPLVTGRPSRANKVLRRESMA
jgi:hypothetical protein